MKKKNLLVIASLFPQYKGDIKGIFVLDYITSLLPYYTISVFTFSLYGEKAGLTIEEIDNYKIYRFVVSSNKRNKFSKIKNYMYLFLWIFFKLPKYFKNINIIHAHNTIFSGLFAKHIANKLHIPYFITEHTGPFSKVSDHKLLLPLAKWIMKDCTAVLPVSNHTKQEILDSGITPTRVEVCFNPVDTNLFKLRTTELIENKSIIFAGRLEDYKGGFRTLKAFEKIFSNYPEWSLTIVGSGPEESEMIKLVNKNNELKNRVVFIGKVTKSEFSDHLKESAIFVFPSQRESFGLVIAEAMSVGVPVIVGNRTAPKEFVCSECGILINPDSIEEISSAMEEMINSIEKYTPTLIRKKVVDSFSFEAFGKKLNKVFN